MGTRRSRHNKGRKPFYKEHGTDSIRHFEDVVKPKRKILAPTLAIRQHVIRNEVDPLLEDRVARYLSRRKAMAEASKNEPKKDLSFRVISGDNFGRELSVAAGANQLVETSERDVLLQLFVERKITAGQLHGGRAWQRWKEQATIQPNVTIDWSAPVSGMHYQRRGDLSQSQFCAMNRRREFIEFAGMAPAAFLDFCLEADRGRAEIMYILRVDGAIVEQIVNELLTEVCRCYGFRAWTLGRTSVYQGQKHAQTSH